MAKLIPAEHYADLLVKDTPLIDVRAPVEYERGSLPGAVNLPLLEDREREAVGKEFQAQGQAAAISMGEQLVSGSIREARVAAWTDFVSRHPHAAIFCFRGGLRSQIVQSWLADEGFAVPRVAGGFKALRRFLMQTLQRVGLSSPLLVVAGKTGCGKTSLVNGFTAGIDLEGLAGHRGSAFGRRLESQPSQIDFEHRLATALLKLPFHRFSRLVVEDEGRAIGSLSIPQTLFDSMRRAPLAIIEDSLDHRVDRILRDYIDDNYREFQTADPENATQLLSNHLLSAMDRIRKRLGDERYGEIRQDLLAALNDQFDTGEQSAHRTWIEKLLRHYYDPMYEYQLEKKSHRIVFRGNREEFQAWARHLNFKGSPAP